MLTMHVDADMDGTLPSHAVLQPHSTHQSAGRFVVGPVDPVPETMLRMLGYADPEHSPERILTIARHMAKRAAGLFRIELAYGFAPGSGRSLALANDSSDGAAFKNCHEVVVFALTMGEPIDVEANALRESGDLAEALMLETAGWYGIERATREFIKWVRIVSRESGLRCTRRYAPGYGDWPLEGQKELFSILREEDCAVSLMESCSMTPRLSRSGAYGLMLDDRGTPKTNIKEKCNAD